MKQPGEALQGNIERQIQRDKLKAEIAHLEKQARAERQPKKKFELVQQTKKLEHELGGF